MARLNINVMSVSTSQYVVTEVKNLYILFWHVIQWYFMEPKK